MSWGDLTQRLLGGANRVFGEQVTYQPAAGGSFEITAIVATSYVGIDADTGAQVSTNSPVASVKLTDFDPHAVTPAIDDQVTVRGNLFRVDDVRKDGEGGATLFLKRTF